MSRAATITRYPAYGGKLVLHFATIDAALAALREGDSLETNPA